MVYHGYNNFEKKFRRDAEFIKTSRQNKKEPIKKINKKFAVVAKEY